MSDAESQTGPRPVHPRCSAAAGTPQAKTDPDRSADACLYCGDRPGREVYHGICWICELGVLTGDLPKPNRDHQHSVTSG